MANPYAGIVVNGVKDLWTLITSDPEAMIAVAVLALAVVARVLLRPFERRQRRRR